MCGNDVGVKDQREIIDFIVTSKAAYRDTDARSIFLTILCVLDYLVYKSLGMKCRVNKKIDA